MVEVQFFPGATTAMLARYPLNDDEPATSWLLDIFSEDWELLDRVTLDGLTDIQDSTRCLNEVNNAVQSAYSAEVYERSRGLNRAAATWNLKVRNTAE